MLSWLKALLAPPTPVGAPRLLKSFKHNAVPLCPRAVPVAPGEWRLAERPSGFAALFQLKNPAIESCLVTFRAEVCADRPVPDAAVELLCRVPRQRRRVIRSLPHDLRPDEGWHFFEVTLHLERGEQPSLLRLGLVTGAPANLGLRNAMVLVTEAA